MLEIVKFDSSLPGKNLLITGVVHGEEICGAKASMRVIDKIRKGELVLNCGSVTFIPIVNVMANKLNRQYYEANLNRCVKPTKNLTIYEYRVANILCDYIRASDYYLDIHSMPNKTEQTFAFADHEEQDEFASIFGLNYVFRGWNNVYKDSKSIEDFTTQTYGYNVGVTSCTVECGYHFDEKTIDVAESCILKALNYLSIAKNNTQSLFKKSVMIDMTKLYFKENESWELAKKFEEMEEIKKGNLLIKCGEQNIIADDDYYIIFPNNRENIKVGEEMLYLGREK